VILAIIVKNWSAAFKIMFKYRFLIIILALACIATKCQKATSELTTPAPAQFDVPSSAWADSLLRTMSLEQKIGQLVVLESDVPTPKIEANVRNWIAKGRIGGLWMSNLPLTEYLRIADTCRRLAPAPLLLATGEAILLNSQFTELPLLPRNLTLQAAGSDTMFTHFRDLYFRQLHALGLNCAIIPSLASTEQGYSDHLHQVDRLNKQHLLSVADHWNARHLRAMRDTSAASLTELQGYQAAINAGVSGFWIDDQLLKDDSIRKLPFSFLKDAFFKRLAFSGLLVARVKTEQDIATWIRAGIDLYVVDRAPERVVVAFRRLLQQKLINQQTIDEKVRKVLLAKSWVKIKAPPLPPAGSFSYYAAAGCLPPEQEIILSHFEDPQWGSVGRVLFEKAANLVHNQNNLLPFKDLRNLDFRLVSHCRQPMSAFYHQVSKYADYQIQQNFILDEGEEFCESLVFIVTMDRLNAGNAADSAFLRRVLATAKRAHVVVVNFGVPALLRDLDTSLTVLQLYEHNQVTETAAAQVLFGALAPHGKLPVTVSAQFPSGAGATFNPVRLKFTAPEDAGIAATRLTGIDRVVYAAIKDRATPGCQVVVAKSGKIIYSKAFGYHTYKADHPVLPDDLYDIASVSKVASTTLAAMKLYGQGRFRLSDHIEDHLPCGKASTIRKIPIRKLLIHQSGLQPHMPVVPYIAYREKDNANCALYFCKNQTDTFSIQVANRFFFNRFFEQQVWKDVHRLPVDRARDYRYSDANFMLLQKILETKMGDMAIDNWMEENFYRPMGLRNTAYCPMKRYERDRIVPTENDQRWRQQLVHGYVHDPTAALLGGIAGNAGLFTNAEDLAVLFQMLMDGGVYGGQRFLNEKTVAHFISNTHGNHRGLGFDRPNEKYRAAYAEQASPETFGHTGFTGTCVWADPKSDLVYVFLSNRLYPDASNWKLFSNRIRERIHEVVYRSFNTYQFYIPELPDWTMPVSS